MQSAFLKAVTPPTATVFRLRLVPFTLGHWFLLLEVAPDLLTSQRAPLSQVLAAVFACSSDWRTSQRNLQSLWARLLGWIWGRSIKSSAIAPGAEAFLDYLTQSLQMPEHKTAGSGRMQSPAPFCLLVSVLSEVGLTWEQAMSCPVARLHALLFAVRELRGQVDPWTDADEALWQFAREQDALKVNW